MSKVYKNTPARNLILEFLQKQKKPVSMDAVYEHVASYGINQSTVYRTINLFVKESIARPVIISKDKLFIELVKDNDHHHHIICTICQKIEDFDICEINDITKKVLKNNKNFKTISRHSFELFGICNNCYKK